MDGWRWKSTPYGCFTVNSAYKELSSQSGPPADLDDKLIWQMIWKAPTPPKVITTVWKALRGRLATCENLMKRRVIAQNSEAKCAFCKTEIETSEHIFFSCSKTEEIWKFLLLWIGKQTALSIKMKDHFLAFINLGSKEDLRFLLGSWMCTIWCIWKGRNECKFNNGIWNKDKMTGEIKTRVWGWLQVFGTPTVLPDFRRWLHSALLHG
ncbi:uncharacterized protein LOC131015749 [Salvia miltiorrhiza]|uniref:uncharacterized protein LOC131015749 n=1 Tax=Salvia miltiorrhiza TaxID=226208 RepID=UPI0025AD2D2E|nr:uncharacterized protein LOC131015749 [Salvia miltiorrhiza]